MTHRDPRQLGMKDKVKVGLRALGIFQGVVRGISRRETDISQKEIWNVRIRTVSNRVSMRSTIRSKKSGVP